MKYTRWKHPAAPSALILDPRYEGLAERFTAREHLCPDGDDHLLTQESVEMTPEEFDALGEFES